MVQRSSESEPRSQVQVNELPMMPIGGKQVDAPVKDRLCTTFTIGHPGYPYTGLTQTAIEPTLPQDPQKRSVTE